jgi:cob(I)alamin adenosyltransferase
MSIVTKTGDQGETGLFDGRRLPKADPTFEVLGDLDELSAHLGLTSTPETRRIQEDLFALGALLAGTKGSMQNALTRIEEEINALEPTLPPLKNFILPGGSPEAAQLHLARAVCRRAERHLTRLPALPEAALPYLNRLSDYLFLLARQRNITSKTAEIIWKA